MVQGYSSSSRQEKLRFHGVGQLALGTLSIHTMNHLATNVIFNLSAYPHYVPILKKELDRIREECGGEFTLESMNKLEKLDSFLHETLRCEHPSAGMLSYRPPRRISQSL